MFEFITREKQENMCSNWITKNSSQKCVEKKKNSRTKILIRKRKKLVDTNTNATRNIDIDIMTKLKMCSNNI